MNDFSYTQAASAKEATALQKDTPAVAYIAGGTTLLDLMKAHLQEHPQLRNMATVGGNILQRTRCGYFRDAAFPCNKRVPGSGCPALTGDHHNLAILGVSESCIANSYPGDFSVALAAFDAVLTIERSKGKQRQVPLNDFYRLPGNTPHIETVLEPGELIVAITIPTAAHAQRSAYLKVRERSSYAYALASAAVGLDVQSGTIRAARVALGGVGAQPRSGASAGRPASHRGHVPGRCCGCLAGRPAARAQPLQSGAGAKHTGARPAASGRGIANKPLPFPIPTAPYARSFYGYRTPILRNQRWPGCRGPAHEPRGRLGKSDRPGQVLGRIQPLAGTGARRAQNQRRGQGPRHGL
ncbi:FAD binding domain-containing protein [Hymenobacter jeongseonensis]